MVGTGTYKLKSVHIPVRLDELVDVPTQAGYRPLSLLAVAVYSDDKEISR